jgi:aryl-alcohol dehydrogenase-like predicted oxidoreductase
MAISGYATATGTQHYQQRQQTHCASGHFRQGNDLTFSSLGVGTYLGQPDDETDTLVTNGITQAVQQGINLIDTAINYRFMRAEKSVQTALNQLLSQGISREELIICTKGGFIPHPEREEWFKQEYVNNPNFSVQANDLVMQSHCLHPQYLQDQLDLSLHHLNLETIDIYYIHNPENQLAEVSPETLHERLAKAFEVMEAAVNAGKIKAYGLATWNGFRVPPNHPNHLDLAKIQQLAQQVAGDSPNHFQFVQIPLNAAMPEALVKPTQKVNSELLPAIRAAEKLGINVIVSASIGQTQAVGKVPPSLQEKLSQQGLNPAQQALQFTRSCSGIASALVGMKTPAHVAENLALTQLDPLEIKASQEQNT